MGMFGWWLAGFLLPALLFLLWVIVKKTSSIKLPAVGSRGKILGACVVVILLGVVGWFFKDDLLKLAFFTAMFIATVLMFVGWRLNKGVKFGPGTIPFWGGVALAIGIVVWNSNYGLWMRNSVAQHEANFNGFCPEETVMNLKNHERGKRPVLIVKKGCTTRLYVAPAVTWSLSFTTNDPVLTMIGKPVDEHVKYTWLGRTLEITPKPEFPVEGEVRLAILDPTEAAAHDLSLVKKALQ